MRLIDTFMWVYLKNHGELCFTHCLILNPIPGIRLQEPFVWTEIRDCNKRNGSHTITADKFQVPPSGETPGQSQPYLLEIPTPMDNGDPEIDSSQRRRVTPNIARDNKLEAAQTKVKRKSQKRKRVNKTPSKKNVDKSTKKPVPKSPHAVTIRNGVEERSRDSGLAVNEGISFMEPDRSLSEMLASCDTATHDADSDIPPAQGTGKWEQIDHLESELKAANVALVDSATQIEYLKSVIDLLNTEYNGQKKALHESQRIVSRQKNEIKRLNRDNDVLRREMSHFRGMRKFTAGKPSPCSESGARNESEENRNSRKANDESVLIRRDINELKTEFVALFERIDEIVRSRVSVVDNGSEFHRVKPRRQNKATSGSAEPSAASSPTHGTSTGDSDIRSPPPSCQQRKPHQQASRHQRPAVGHQAG